MLTAVIALQLALIVGGVGALVWFVRARHGAAWRLLGIGAATFVGSQVIHLPLNSALGALLRLPFAANMPEAWQLPVSALLAGLTAGLCEEGARYLVLRYWAVDARRWAAGLALGIGHGGAEALILAALVLATLLTMVVVRGMDDLDLGLDEEMQVQLREAVDAYWQTPLYIPLLSAAERWMAIAVQLALTVLVQRAFVLRRLWPFWAAMALHTLVDAAAVYVLVTWGAIVVEAALAVFAAGSVAILWATWRADRRAAANGLRSSP
ncbi:MAG: YhfC family intramembrane metalloprotease [Anaerolineae bacterium]|nr:YhfC family intramembrane metalloprotease [Anaerolineae bacterium]